MAGPKPTARTSYASKVRRTKGKQSFVKRQAVPTIALKRKPQRRTRAQRPNKIQSLINKVSANNSVQPRANPLNRRPPGRKTLSTSTAFVKGKQKQATLSSMQAASAAPAIPLLRPTPIRGKGPFQSAADTVKGETDGYRQLAIRNEQMGADLLDTAHHEVARDRSLGRPPRYPSTPEGAHLQEAHRIIRDALTARSVEGFNDDWRDVEDHMDELASTATMRSMVSGAISALKRVPVSDQKAVTEHFAQQLAKLSLLRQSTISVGGTRSGVAVQHPSNAALAIWAGDPITGKREARAHDVVRRQVATVAAETEIKRGASLAGTVDAIGRAVTDYHLNDFTGSAMASDMKPYGGRTRQQKLTAALDRERVKRRGVEYFGLQQHGGPKSTQPMNSPHHTASHPGKASPMRV